MIAFFSLLITLLSFQSLFADPGLRAWEKEKYDEARTYYQKRLEKEDKAILHYNLGTSAHKEGDAELAEKALNQALRSNDTDFLAKAHYNLGQVQLQQQNLQGAAENFLKSILYDPSDPNAKAMYELTRQLMQQQEQQQGGDKSQEQDQQKQNQDQNNNQQQNEEENQQQNTQNNQKENDQQEQSAMAAAPEEQQMSDDQAENILNAMREREKEAMKKLLNQQYKGSKIKRSKDW